MPNNYVTLEVTAEDLNTIIDKVDKETGKNLFNKDEVFVGYNYGGDTMHDPNYYRSDYILIKPSTAYYKNSNKYYSWYTAGKVYIGGSSSGNQMLSPSNARYVIISILAGELNNAQLELGTVGTSYEAYVNKSLVSTADIAQITTNKNDIAQEIFSRKQSDISLELLIDDKVDKETGKSLVSTADIAQITTNKNNITNLITSKVNVSDIADNLTTDNSLKVLSAKQGKLLDEKIADLEFYKADKTTVIVQLGTKVDKETDKSLISTTDIAQISTNKLNSEKLEQYGTTDIEISPDSYFTFSTANGSASITGLTNAGKQVSGEFVIPYTLGGCNVTKIGNRAFAMATKITNFVIPKSVNMIDEYAFNGCTGITTMIIPDSVTEIADGAFNYCTNLVNIKLSSNIKIINNFTFNKCSKLEEIIIPFGVTTIGGYAFSECSDLLKAYIPKTVKYIFAKAFYACVALGKTVLSPNIEFIDDGITTKSFDVCNNAVFYVAKDSVAHTYAVNNNKTYFFSDVDSASISQITTNKNNILALTSSKNIANGIVGLDSGARMSATNLPYNLVRDVVVEAAWKTGTLTGGGTKTFRYVNPAASDWTPADGHPIEFRANTGALPAGVLAYNSDLIGGTYYNIGNVVQTSISPNIYEFDIYSDVARTTKVTPSDTGTTGYQVRLAGVSTIDIGGIDTSACFLHKIILTNFGFAKKSTDSGYGTFYRLNNSSTYNYLDQYNQLYSHSALMGEEYITKKYSIGTHCFFLSRFAGTADYTLERKTTIKSSDNKSTNVSVFNTSSVGYVNNAATVTSIRVYTNDDTKELIRNGTLVRVWRIN